MFYSDDPVMDEMRHTRAMDLRLARRPVCRCCKRHIQDEQAVHFDDIWLCLACIEDNTEYIED
jgi:hypothetical protein